MNKKLLLTVLITCVSFNIFSQINFVCIGNSITHGSTAPGVFNGTSIGDSLTEMSYRFWFWEKVDSALPSANATMVGYQTIYFNQGGSLTSTSRYTGHTFVNHHEGYYGIKSDGFLAGGWGGSPDFDTRLAGYSPDVALIHMGSNDPYTTSLEIDATEANIISIIQKLRNKNPNVTILLAKLSSFWSGINGRVDGIVLKTSQVNSIVYPVDIASDFFQDDKNGKTFLLDGIHPNVKGQKVMAKRWYDAYMKITKADSEKPSIPAGLYSTAMTATSIDLRWSASTDNTGVNVYKIYMNDSLVAVTADISYKIIGITTGTKTYIFKVAAVDYQKNESDKSISIKAPSSVTFSVFDGTAPISGATVTFNSVNQTTNGSGATTFSGQRPGSFNYTVKATGFKNRAGNAIVKTDTTIMITLSGADLSSEQDGILLFPNPAKNNITIKNAENAIVEIINETGICVLSVKIISDEDVIDVSSLPVGYYTVKITRDKIITTEKIIIAK